MIAHLQAATFHLKTNCGHKPQTNKGDNNISDEQYRMNNRSKPDFSPKAIQIAKNINPDARNIASDLKSSNWFETFKKIGRIWYRSRLIEYRASMMLPKMTS